MLCSQSNWEAVFCECMGGLLNPLNRDKKQTTRASQFPRVGWGGSVSRQGVHWCQESPPTTDKRLNSLKLTLYTHGSRVVGLNICTGKSDQVLSLWCLKAASRSVWLAHIFNYTTWPNWICETLCDSELYYALGTVRTLTLSVSATVCVPAADKVWLIVPERKYEK